MKRFIIIILTAVLLLTCEDYERFVIVKTLPITNITSTSATLQGEIIDRGEGIKECGHYWWENGKEATPSKKSNSNTKTGNYLSTISNLKPATLYYTKAYATDGHEPVFGEILSFTTLGIPPEAAFTASDTVITAGQSIQYTDQSANNPTSWSWDFGDGSTSTTKNPSHTYATAGTYTVTLTVTNNYGSDDESKTNYITVNAAEIPPVAAFTATPTTILEGQSVQFTDQSTNLPTSWSWDFGDGEYSTEQNPSHVYVTAGTYSVMLTVTNSYGSDSETKNDFVSVTDSIGTFTDNRDGIEYKWVTIGSQVWMAENLSYLPAVSPPTEESYTEPYYYVIDYYGTSVNEAKATSNYITYGVLYNWPAAISGSESSNKNPSGVKGICPVGWHLPSDAEWQQLVDFVSYEGHSGAEGTALKATSGWLGGNGTDVYGFSALPGSYRNHDSTFYYVGNFGDWWSATEYYPNPNMAYSRYMYHVESIVYQYFSQKDYGFSIRCIRD